MFDELVNQRIKGAGAKLLPFIDTFDPGTFVPYDRVRLAGREVIPALLSALAENGLSVFAGYDLNIIADVCRRSGGEMRLIQSADPQFHPNVSPADSNVTVLARDGEAVGCVASRLVWCEDTLATEMESGRFWVSDPATMWSEDERCITTAMSASIRACHVVYCGSVYLDPSIRGGNTLAAMMRLHLMWLVCHWRWSWLIGLVRGDLIHHHAFDIYGAHTLQQALWRDRDSDGEMHRYQLCVSDRSMCMDAWLRPEMGDLARPLGLPPKSVMPHEAPLPALRRRRAAAPPLSPAPVMAQASGM